MKIGNIPWLTMKHGDRIDLTVTEEDQLLGTPGSATKCAVVQTIYRSSSDVYKAKVVEGGVHVFVHDEDGIHHWRGRAILDNPTREMATKYDQGESPAPTKITLVMDKWHEVDYVSPAEKAKAKAKADDKAACQPSAAEVTREVTFEATATPSEPVKQEPPKPKKTRSPRGPRKNRWDTSHFLVPKRA